MANPAAGSNYTVRQSDHLRGLRGIAAMAYGNEMKWRRIYDANQDKIGTDPDLIIPGQVLFIPPEEEKTEQETAISEARGPKGSVGVFIDGVEYPSKQGRFAWAMDTMASSFSADFVWNPGADPGFDAATRRGSFAPAQLYLLGKLVCTGRLYARTNRFGVNEITKNLVFFSKTKDVVDTSLDIKWKEMDNSTVQQIAEEICGVLGFQTRFPDGPGKPFESIDGVPAYETVGKYLQRLAASQSLFITCDNAGGLVFQKLKISSAPVAHIDTGGRIATDYQTTYDDTRRFANYVAVAKAADGASARSKGCADLPEVPGARQYIFNADENAADTLDQMAEWACFKINLQAAELRLPVSTWTDSNGDLWTPNTAVTVKSPVLIETEKTMKYIIRGVEFEWNADSRTAVLSLVPPFKTEGGKLAVEW